MPNRIILPPKYNRIKQKRKNIIKRNHNELNNNNNNSSSEEEEEEKKFKEYSEISSLNDNSSFDDDILIEKMWRLAGNHNLVKTIEISFSKN